MTTTRRDLLTGSVALVAAPLMPIAAAPVADMVPELAATWRRLYALACAEEDDEALTAMSDRARALVERIAQTSAISRAGIVAKLKIAIQHDAVVDDIVTELMESAIADLEHPAMGGAA